VAAKKKSGRKSAARKGAAKKGAGMLPGGIKCTNKNICDYLQRLSDWLEYDFYPSHVRLQQAVCNLERTLILGQPNKPGLMQCPGGGGGAEPPVPPRPPKW
jgi:hypothetical protein